MEKFPKNFKIFSKYFLKKTFFFFKIGVEADFFLSRLPWKPNLEKFSGNTDLPPGGTVREMEQKKRKIYHSVTTLLLISKLFLIQLKNLSLFKLIKIHYFQIIIRIFYSYTNIRLSLY